MAYDQFNQARTEFYRQRKVFGGLIPASTGVGGRNPAGTALIAGGWAVQAVGASEVVREVVSSLQNTAQDYGSAFSRAVLLDEEDCKRLLISGTASIAPDGGSAHSGELNKQIELTMDVVQQLLLSQGFGFADITRATAYFKDIQKAGEFGKWA